MALASRLPPAPAPNLGLGTLRNSLAHVKRAEAGPWRTVSLGNDHALGRVGMEVAFEVEAADGERPDPHFGFLAGRDHLFDGRRMHLELVGGVVQILYADEERLTVRHTDFRRRETMVLQCERICLQIFRARRRGFGASQCGRGENNKYQLHDSRLALTRPATLSHDAASNSLCPMNSPSAAPAGTAKWAPPTLVTNWFIMSKRDIFWKMLMKPA